MIENKNLSIELVEALNKCSGILNQTIIQVQENCSNNEFEKYRKGAGFVMGYLYLEFLDPIYKMHPELEPLALKNVDI